MTPYLIVPFLPVLRCNSPLERISELLSETERHHLSFTPWADFDFKPGVQFQMAYGADAIFLRYEVVEPFLRAAHGAINSDVYKDSCVEFFVSFDESGYYNFEFNCIGATLGGYGKDRNNRQQLPLETLTRIRTQAVISRNAPGQDVRWSLTIVLPLEVLVFHRFSSLSGVACRGNFYKCGDELPRPHFVTWANIEAPGPNFHLPGFFGEIRFE